MLETKESTLERIGLHSVITGCIDRVTTLKIEPTPTAVTTEEEEGFGCLFGSNPKV